MISPRQRVKSLKQLTVLIHKSGGYFKARFAGRADYAFGISPQEAEQKLRSGRLRLRQPTPR